MKIISIALFGLALSTACIGTASAAENPNEMIVSQDTKPVADMFHIAPVLRAGEFVYISGVPAALPNIEDPSSEEIMMALKKAYLTAFYQLEKAGASKYDIVDITTFHTNLSSTKKEIVQVHKELFDKDPYPAWTVVGVDELFMDTAFFELKLTARLQK